MKTDTEPQPTADLRNMTVSVPRSEAILAPLAMSVTAAPDSAPRKKVTAGANRRPPSLVDVSRGRHRGPQGGVAVTSGPACGCAPQLLHQPVPRGRSGLTQVNDSSQPATVGI